LEYIDQMGMDRLLELLDYFDRWPPSHVILGLVHQADRVRKKKIEAATAEDEKRDLGALASAMGAQGIPSTLPPHLQKLADEATALSSKMRSKHV
jgi:hypothetical protein